MSELPLAIDEAAYQEAVEMVGWVRSSTGNAKTEVERKVVENVLCMSEFGKYYELAMTQSTEGSDILKSINGEAVKTYRDDLLDEFRNKIISRLESQGLKSQDGFKNEIMAAEFYQNSIDSSQKAK